MIDRDPITEPAGELVAAQTLVEILAWLEEGGTERYAQLAETLLDWKGRRLEDAISQTAIVKLQERVPTLSPTTTVDYLDRLARAAGLALDGAALSIFVRDYLNLYPGDSAFRLARLRALDGLIKLLPRRKDRDILEAAQLMLTHRAVLAVDEPDTEGVPRNLRADFVLADYLYQHFGRNEQVARNLRDWFIANAEYILPNKLRVLRTAAILGHNDVVEAYFECGSATQPETSSSFADSARKLVVDRLADHAPALLMRVAQHIAGHLQKRTGDRASLLLWTLELARRAAIKGPADPTTQALDKLGPPAASIVKAKPSGAVHEELARLLQG